MWSVTIRQFLLPCKKLDQGQFFLRVVALVQTLRELFNEDKVWPRI